MKASKLFEKYKIFETWRQQQQMILEEVWKYIIRSKKENKINSTQVTKKKNIKTVLHGQKPNHIVEVQQ
jgi:hypothetical protein